MDITLMRASVYELPSRRRVDVLVYDGSQDMQLWPGRGPDTELNRRWGGGLQGALDAEVRQLDDRLLSMGDIARVRPGRLRCDFLGWVATRPPQRGSKPEPAPSLEVLAKAVHTALAYAVDRHVDRVGFGELGAGPGEAPVVERLAAIARAARAFEVERASAGIATPIDEVLVCTSLGATYQRVARELGDLVQLSDPVARPEPAAAERVARKRRAPAPSGTSASQKRPGRPRKLDRSSRRVAPKPRAPAKAAPKLDPGELEANRHTAPNYTMRKTYAVGEWLTHPKFGVGCVLEVVKGGSTPQVRVLFETMGEKRLVHGRE